MSLLDILRTVAALGALVFFVWQAFAYLRFWYRQKRIGRMSTEELKALFEDASKGLLFGPAILELKNRGEDISFALGAVIDMATGPNRMGRSLGRSLLRRHFAGQLGDIDLSQKKLSAETMEKLRELRRRV